MKDILLCDLDAFFASVEQRDHPEYRGKPVIVGGDPRGRGVVSACSYEARKYGVRSAMPMKKALRLCPQCIVLPVDRWRYEQVSDQVFAIFERFTPEIEKVSVDEAYLAVPKGEGVEIAQTIRKAVREELDLSLSVGVSSNKLLAKMACELAKPDGLRAVWPEEVPQIIWPLPVGNLPGVGAKTERVLKTMGIYTIGDLVGKGEAEIIERLGSAGRELLLFARGIDYRRLETVQEAKSLGKETTFEQDKWDREEVIAALAFLCGEVGYRLRSYRLKCRTVTLKIRRGDFSTYSRSRTLAVDTDLDGDIYRAAKELFEKSGVKPPWRLIGVQVGGLGPKDIEQLSLEAGDGKQKEEKLLGAVDTLRRKYGKSVVQRAVILRTVRDKE
ncbi:MAG: DNA polymerase IV [Moorellaceae bacterium]